MAIVPEAGGSSLTAATQPSQGWGWNPLTDIMHGAQDVGSALNDWTHIGNLNAGIGSAVQTVADIVPGIANLGYQAGKDIVTGQGQKLEQLAGGVGHGLATGLASTFTDLGTLGGLAPWTQRWENEVGNVTGGYLQPQSLLQQAETPNGPGLLGGALNDALNLTLLGDGAAKVAQLGDVGEAATAAQAAERAGKVAAADDIGKTLPEIAQAGEDAKNAAIEEHSGGDPVMAQRIASRLQLLDSVETYRSMVQGVINPINPLKTLGRAASAAELPESTTNLGTEPSPEVPPPGGFPAELEPDVKAAVDQARQQAGVRQAMVQMGNHVTLYRGEGLDLAAGSGAAIPDTGSGHWFTDSPEVAEQYANGGQVLKVDVPESVADAAQSHSMWGEDGSKIGTAYNLEEHGPQYTEDARTLAPPVLRPSEPTPIENAARPLTQRVLENVPAAYKSYLERSQPIPEWAKQIVGHLPEPFVKLLRWSDQLRQLHESQVITRQTKVALNVVAREVENDPAVLALKERAAQMMTERIPGVTPEVASHVIGERLQAALVLGPLWDELEQMRPELDAIAPGLTDHILGFNADFPKEYDTPEFRQEIQELAAPIRELRQQHLEQLASSPFFAGKGLDMANLDGAMMTKSETALWNQAQDLIKQAAEKEAEGHLRAEGEIADAIRERTEARRAALEPSAEGERMRYHAGEIENEGREDAHAQVAELERQRGTELEEAQRPSPEGEQLRQRDQFLEAQQRAELQAESGRQRVEGARQAARAAAPSPEADNARQAALAARAAGNEPLAAHLEDQASHLEDLKNQDADLKGKLAGRAADLADEKLAQEHIGTPELRDRADVLDQQHQQLHSANAVALDHQARDLGNQIESGTLPTDRQGAMVRENAVQADEAMQNQKAAVIIRANQHIKDLQTQLESHMLPEQQEAQELTEKASTLQERVAEKLGRAGPSRVAPKWQPLLLAGKRMADAVDQYPELEPILETLPKTFGDAMDYADLHGFDPTHMPDLTVERVQQMVNGTVRLGGEAGKEFESSARKARLGTLAEQDLADRSIESVIAGLVHATQEDRTNMVINWLERTIARPIPLNGRGAAVIPDGWDDYDTTRRGLLAATNPEGEEQAVKGGARLMIPHVVARGIAEYAETASNPLARAMQYITDPWRFFMLTLNPSFYLHHIMGHVMLNLIQGNTSLSAWRQAYEAARGGFEDLPEVTGQNIIQGELGKPGVVEYPDFKTALAQGGKRAAMDYLSGMSHKVITFTDSFSRAVDYFSRKDEGFTDMEAMQHANTMLVDYGNLSPMEKTVARSFIPFYGFEKGILQIALKMPIDHPLITNVLMNVGKWQEHQAVDANGNPLPSGYQGVVNLFGHNVNLKSLSPFKDLGGLTTPAGLMTNLQYALQAVIRSGLNAPAPFSKAGTQVGPYGTLEPRVTVASQLLPALASSPQGQLAAGLTGNSTKTPGQAALGFAGLPLVNQQTLNNAGQRNVLSTAEVANSTPAQQAAETAFPVDTQTAEAALAQNASAPGGPLVPTNMNGQQVTQAQIMAALQKAQQAQAAATAATKGRGETKSGIKVSAKRGGSHRSKIGEKHVGARIRRGSSGSKKMHVAKIHVSHATKSKLRQGFGKAHNTNRQGGGNGVTIKSGIRGVPGVDKKRKKVG